MADAEGEGDPRARPVLVEAEPLARRAFASWAAFDRYMEEYFRSTFQLFRKRTSTSVSLRNRRVSERADGAKALRESPPPPHPHPHAHPHPSPLTPPAARLIPEHYANYSVTLVCTHSGAYVPRGTGKRSRQEVRARRCDAQINACLKLADAARDVYEVRVTRALLAHNHALDRETFGQYSNTRVNLPDALLECVELMRRAGVKPRDIRAYVMQHSSCVPTVKDVQNLLTRLKHQADSRPQDDAPPLSQRVHDLLDRRDDALPDQLSAAEAQGLSAPSAVVDTMAQFQLADAMGRRVARVLAEMPPDRFADALRIMELAEAIVLERRRAEPDAA